jgi:hypothetical protein
VCPNPFFKPEQVSVQAAAAAVHSLHERLLGLHGARQRPQHLLSADWPSSGPASQDCSKVRGFALRCPDHDIGHFAEASELCKLTCGLRLQRSDFALQRLTRLK